MTVPMTYFRSYPDPFYSDWRSEPVPGWGARPVMAGPRMVGVGDGESQKSSSDAIEWLKKNGTLIATGALGGVVGYVATKMVLQRSKGMKQNRRSRRRR